MPVRLEDRLEEVFDRTGRQPRWLVARTCYYAISTLISILAVLEMASQRSKAGSGRFWERGSWALNIMSITIGCCNIVINARACSPARRDIPAPWFWVLDFLWVFILAPAGYLFNNMYKVFDIDHVACAAILTFIAVFLDLSFTVTTLCGVTIVAPVFTFVEYQAHLRRLKEAAEHLLRIQQQQQCKANILPLLPSVCAAEPIDSAEGYCALYTPPQLDNHLPDPPTAIDFLQRAVLVSCVCVVLNLVAQVLLNLQDVYFNHHDVWQQQQQPQSQQSLQSQQQQQQLQESLQDAIASAAEQHTGPAQNGLLAVLARHIVAMQKTTAGWDRAFFSMALKLPFTAFAAIACAPVVLYTVLRAFLGLLYWQQGNNFSPTWVLVTGICVAVLARLDLRPLLQASLEQQRRSQQLAEDLKMLRTTNAGLLLEREALQAQLLMQNYQPHASIDTGTPAEKLLLLIRQLMTRDDQLLAPEELQHLQDVLLSGNDVYQPVDLETKLIEASMEAGNADIGTHLAVTLGHNLTRWRESGAGARSVAASSQHGNNSVAASHASHAGQSSHFFSRNTSVTGGITSGGAGTPPNRPATNEQLLPMAHSGDSAAQATASGALDDWPEQMAAAPKSDAGSVEQAVFQGPSASEVLIEAGAPELTSILESAALEQAGGVEAAVDPDPGQIVLRSALHHIIVKEPAATDAGTAAVTPTGRAADIHEAASSMPLTPEITTPPPLQDISHPFSQDQSVQSPPPPASVAIRQVAPTSPTITVSPLVADAKPVEHMASAPIPHSVLEVTRVTSVDHPLTRVASEQPVTRTGSDQDRPQTPETRDGQQLQRTLSSTLDLQGSKEVVLDQEGHSAGSGGSGSQQQQPGPGSGDVLNTPPQWEERSSTPRMTHANKVFGAAPQAEAPAGGTESVGPPAAADPSAAIQDSAVDLMSVGSASLGSFVVPVQLQPPPPQPPPAQHAVLEIPPRIVPLRVRTSASGAVSAGMERLSRLSQPGGLVQETVPPSVRSVLRSAASFTGPGRNLGAQAQSPPSMRVLRTGSGTYSEPSWPVLQPGQFLLSPRDSQHDDILLQHHAQHAQHVLGWPEEPDVETDQSGNPQPPYALLDKVEQLLCHVEDWGFNVFTLHDETQGHPLSTLSFFLINRAGLIQDFKMDPWCLVRFLCRVEAGYMNNPYHNKTHAAHVLHRLHMTLTWGGYRPHYADNLSLLAAYLSAAIHDYEHMGVTNDFLITTQDRLAILYNDKAPLENHHLAASWSLAKQPGYDFLSNMPRAQFNSMRKLVIDLVLATDMKVHFSLLSQFTAVHANATRQSKLPGAASGNSNTPAPTGNSTMTPQPSGSNASRTWRGGPLPRARDTLIRMVSSTLHRAAGGAASGPVLRGTSSASSQLQPPQHQASAGPLQPVQSSGAGTPADSTPAASRVHSHVSVATSAGGEKQHMAMHRASMSSQRSGSRPSGIVRRGSSSSQLIPLPRSSLYGNDLLPERPERSARSAGPQFGHMPPLLAATPRGPRAPTPLRRSTADEPVQRSLASPLPSGSLRPVKSDRSKSSQQGPVLKVTTSGPSSSVRGNSTCVSVSGSCTPMFNGHEGAMPVMPLDENERVLSLQMALKAADLCNLCDPPDTHIQWIQRLEEEFFLQGDQERQLGLPITPLFDRNKPGVSKSQVAFMDIVAVPLFRSLASVFPGSEPLLRGLMSNYASWSEEESKRKAAEQAAKEEATTAAAAAAQAEVAQEAAEAAEAAKAEEQSQVEQDAADVVKSDQEEQLRSEQEVGAVKAAEQSASEQEAKLAQADRVQVAETQVVEAQVVEVQADQETMVQKGKEAMLQQDPQELTGAGASLHEQENGEGINQPQHDE